METWLGLIEDKPIVYCLRHGGEKEEGQLRGAEKRTVYLEHSYKELGGVTIITCSESYDLSFRRSLIDQSFCVPSRLVGSRESSAIVCSLRHGWL